MTAPNIAIETMRRSTRLRIEIPVRLLSADASVPFDILTHTLIVNAQGCGLQTNIEIPVSTPVRLAVQDRVASGHVLNSTLVDANRNVWVVGVELEESGNIWGVDPAPADWVTASPATSDSAPDIVEGSSARLHPFAKRTAPKPKVQVAAATLPTTPPAGVPAVDVEALRSRFEALLEEFRARLRTQVSADWEHWRADATSALRTIQTELGRELAADAERWRHETRKAAETLSGLLKSSDDRARLSEEQGRQVAAIADAVRSEIAAAVEKIRLQAATAQEANRKAGADGESSRAEMARLGAELRDFVSRAKDSAGSHIEQKLSAAITVGMQQLRGHLEEMSGAANAEIRRRLLADFEDRQAAFIAAATAQLAEIQSREASFRSTASEWLSQLSRQAEQSMAGLRVHVQKLVAQHESELAARLSARQVEIEHQLDSGSGERLRALQTAGEQALQAIDEHKRVSAGIQSDLTRAAEAALEDIDGRRAAAKAALDQATADSLQKLNAGIDVGEQRLEARLQQQAWEHDAQAEAAGARLQDRLAAALQKLESDIEQKQAALVAHLTTDAAKVVEQARSTLQSESERQSGAFRERIDLEQQQREAELQLRQQALEAQHQQVAAEVAELQKTRKEIESLMAAIPDAMKTQAQQHSREEWNGLRASTEKYIAEMLQAETTRGAAQLLEEVSASARQLREEMAAQAEQTAAQLQGKLAAMLAVRQQQVSRDLEAQVAQLQAREQSVEKQLQAAAAEQVQGLRVAADAQSQALKKQLDEAQQWLGEHSAEFQRTVHDAFLLAGGEIRGRVHAAVDSADEMIRQKSKDAIANVDSASAQHVQALAHQAEQAEARITGIQNSATSSTEAVLKSRLAETLELFREDSTRLAASALARWQSAMEDTLRSIPDLLRNKLASHEKGASGI